MKITRKLLISVLCAMAPLSQAFANENDEFLKNRENLRKALVGKYVGAPSNNQCLESIQLSFNYYLMVTTPSGAVIAKVNMDQRNIDRISASLLVMEETKTTVLNKPGFIQLEKSQRECSKIEFFPIPTPCTPWKRMSLVTLDGQSQLSVTLFKKGSETVDFPLNTVCKYTKVPN